MSQDLVLGNQYQLCVSFRSLVSHHDTNSYFQTIPCLGDSVCSRGCLGVPGRLKLSAGCLKLLILPLKGVQLFKQIIN